ncbi:MAG: hypothetical protein M3Q09_02340 [Gemmatimonadota bacterium]|nr:hypothetical protein [Gemmatimonadota bacterium]
MLQHAGNAGQCREWIGDFSKHGDEDGKIEAVLGEWKRFTGVSSRETDVVDTGGFKPGPRLGKHLFLNIQQLEVA